MKTCPISISEEDRILIVAPHPDDESIGVGGLIALYPQQCEVIVMTDGRYGNDNYSPEKMKYIRKQEFISAMNLGKIRKFDLKAIEDGNLIFNKAVFDNIEYEKYTHIFLPNPNDHHSDHTACFEYVTEKLRNIDNIKVEVYQYEVHNPLPEVNVHLDITDIIEAKKKMVECYKSQMDIHSYGNQIVALAQYRGLQNEKVGRLLETYMRVELNKDCKKKSIGVETELAKYKWFTHVLSEWMDLNRNGKNLSNILLEKGYVNIAVYGYGIIGKMLYDELKDTKCNVKCIIDRNVDIKIDDIPVYHDLRDINYVDAVVVTVSIDCEKVVGNITDRYGLKTISISDILEQKE